jgi:hypothetical protein
MSMMKWLLVCTLAVPSLAQAADDAWQNLGLLYVYVPTIDGQTTFPDAPGGGVGIDAGSVLNLQAAFMGSFAASKGRWGLFADVVYADVGASTSPARQFSIGGDRVPVDVTAKVHFGLNGWCWTLVGTYALVESQDAEIEVIGGARVLDLNEDLSWHLSGNVGSIPIEAREGRQEASPTNWDAVVGARARVKLGDNGRWFVPLHADVGAGDSKLTWQAVLGLGYTFGWGDVLAAWRHLDYEMKSGSEIESISFDGPAVGVAFHW